MRYRIYVTIAVDADNDLEARECASKLKELLRDPTVKMAVAIKGIRLFADVQPVVHQPQREF